jgi:hypothetical protein
MQLLSAQAQPLGHLQPEHRPVEGDGRFETGDVYTGVVQANHGHRAVVVQRAPLCCPCRARRLPRSSQTAVLGCAPTRGLWGDGVACVRARPRSPRCQAQAGRRAATTRHLRRRDLAPATGPASAPAVDGPRLRRDRPAQTRPSPRCSPRPFPPNYRRVERMPAPTGALSGAGRIAEPEPQTSARGRKSGCASIPCARGRSRARSGRDGVPTAVWCVVE